MKIQFNSRVEISPGLMATQAAARQQGKRVAIECIHAFSYSECIHDFLIVNVFMIFL